MDWDFADNKTSHSIHSIHPYPAKFIPELPAKLIKELGIEPNTALLDPFCGSGTSLSVCQEMGIESIGIDLNPIACLISEVKTSILADDFMVLANSLIESARRQYVDISSGINIPNVDHWFKTEVQEAIVAIKCQISRVADKSNKKALSFCLSSILVKISNQDSDTRYAAIEKNISKNAVFDQFLNAAKRLYAIKVSEKKYESKVTIINNDILSVKPKDIKSKVGLVITSPPYPNAYEYWLYHKYRMFWLDYDPLSVKEKEIGARAHFFKKNHHTADNFLDQMTRTLKLINEVLIYGGAAAFVVGRSKIHGEIVDNADIVSRAASAVGLGYEGTIVRTIKSSRKSFNLSHANIKEEKIVILRKTKS